MEVKREMVKVPVVYVEERPRYTLVLDEGEVLDIMGALTTARVHLRQLIDRTGCSGEVRENIEKRRDRQRVLREALQMSRLQRG